MPLDRLLIWLGEDFDSSIGRALLLLLAIQATAHYFGLAGHSRYMIEGNATSDCPRQPHPSLQALLSNPYWSRAWIIQEVILALRARIVHRTYTIEYKSRQEGVLVEYPDCRHRYGFALETKHYFRPRICACHRTICNSCICQSRVLYHRIGV